MDKPHEQDVTPTTGLTPTSSSIPLTSDDSDGFLGIGLCSSTDIDSTSRAPLDWFIFEYRNMYIDRK